MPGNVQVPVFHTTRDAYRTPFANWAAFVRIGWLPLLLIVGVDVFFVEVIRPMFGRTSGLTLPRALVSEINLTVKLIRFFLFTCILAQWHRHVLLDGAVRHEGSGLRHVGRNAIYFVSAVCVVYVLGESQPVHVQPFKMESIFVFRHYLRIIFFLPFILLFLAFAGISPLFPDIALNTRLKLGAALQVSRGNEWRIVAVIVLCAAPFVVGNSIFKNDLFLWLLRFTNASNYFLLGLVSWLPAFLGAVVVTSALSLIYKQMSPDVVQEARNSIPTEDNT